jgi:CelD/BcsL family acetyltransferase involved in cellulose biosynthesis
MTNIRLTRVPDLTDADWQLWLDIQERSGGYESPYFRPEFARAVAAARDDVEVAVLEEQGQIVGFFPFQRGSMNLGKPLGGKLSDYHGPLVRQGARFDILALVSGCRLATWDFDHLIGPVQLFEPYITIRDSSPQLDLVEGYAAYAQRRREAGSDTIHKNGQKSRKLAREVGPLRFTFDADDEQAYEQLKAWKSAQYLRTGLADVFSFPWTLELLARLRQQRSDEFSAPLTVLRAGDTLAAVALSLRSRGVLHVWFNAYNPDLANYSPGVMLLVEMAQEANSRGIHKIDLGRGSERYKWSLASGGVEVCEGSVACRSLATWFRRGWRQTRHWVANSPLKETAKLPAKLIRPLRQWLAYH